MKQKIKYRRIRYAGIFLLIAGFSSMQFCFSTAESFSRHLVAGPVQPGMLTSGNKFQDSLLRDGPYVFYRNEKIITKSIYSVNNSLLVKEDSVTLSQKSALLLKVATDQPGVFFEFRLKDQLEEEKSIFKGVNKQLVLSDIEGNFTAFRKLLQANGVLDNGLNWTFGKGHLVLIGDFFDRGDQVTEVLWFVYSLEEKAKAAGGYVHFVLGNHEIMNLSGDLRYLNTKYPADAALMGEKYMALFATDTELGRWLRTKNIIERVGELLYIHGGISPVMNRLAMPAKDIDHISRPFYADTSYDYKDQRLNIVLGDLGPFWYRGYYSGKVKATEDQIDSTLLLNSVKHIVTGHSIVADTVSSWFRGKLFNTDTHHAEGKSEALLVEGDRYYRVNTSGTKYLLAVD